jgi:magnesium-transporting ATPase (P-type)
MSYEVNVLITLMSDAMTISSLLIAVITFLLKEYQDRLPSKERGEPYKRLAELMMLVLTLSVITSLLSFVGITFYESFREYFHTIYSLCIGFFISAALLILIGMIFVMRLFW